MHFVYSSFIPPIHKFYKNQGKGNVILTNNYKGKFPHNPFPLFLPFSYPPLFSYIKKNNIYPHLISKGFVIFFVEFIVRIARTDKIYVIVKFLDNNISNKRYLS